MKLRGLNGLFLKNKDLVTKSFFTLIVPVSLPHIQDIDGNVYTYVTIGTQQWIVENLKTVHYADGTTIPNITDPVLWDDDISGAYCWLQNNIENKDVHGGLYNWYAVNNIHGLAIDGWRVPSETDLDILITFLGGSLVAGGKLKEVGLTHWLTPNMGATDEYGFRARGSGYKVYGSGFGAGFGYILELSLVWSSTESNVDDAVYRYLGYYDSTVTGGSPNSKHQGFSVRLMRDI